MDEITVYWGSGSQPAWRVLLALEVQGVPYTSKLLSFGQGDHKTEAFAKLNPRKKVPVLTDGETVVSESVAILAYLDRRFPNKPLFGRTPAEAGAVWQSLLEQQNYLEPPLMRVVRALFFNRAEEKAAQVREDIEATARELPNWERALEGRQWLVGGGLSAADIALFPTLMSVRRAAQKPQAAGFELPIVPTAESFPNLAAWMARVEALPGYERTYPPHWR